MNLVSFSPTFKLNFYLAKVRIRVRFDAMQNVVNQRKALFRGGDVWNTYLLHLLLHQRRSWTALFCVASRREDWLRSLRNIQEILMLHSLAQSLSLGENKKIPIFMKIRILHCFAFLCCGATRNLFSLFYLIVKIKRNEKYIEI